MALIAESVSPPERATTCHAASAAIPIPSSVTRMPAVRPTRLVLPGTCSVGDCPLIL